MDPMLSKAILRNDEVAFKRLVQHDKRVLKRRSAISLDSVLHLASRLGHIEIVTEIVRLCPDLVAEENEKQETPLHAACLSGNVKVVKLLLETNPMAATKLNHENQSAFSLACREGHLDVVKFIMLNQSWLMELEEDTVDSNPIYMAASRGRNDIVKEILQVQPNFARKINENGFSPLHCASSRGQLEITKLLLSSNPDLALQYNNYGYTPLHLAVINGYVTILEVFISSSPNSFQCLTKKGETVFHLAVRFNRYNALICLAKVSDFSHLLHQQDRDGNTILHLAVSRKNLQLVEFILNTTMDIDCQNDKGQTALDMVEHFGRETENKLIKEMLKTASVDQSMGLSSVAPEIEKPHPEEVQTLSSPEIENTNPEELQTLENPRDALEEKIRSLLQSRSKHKLRMMPNPRMDLLNQEFLMERMDLPTNPLQHKHLSKSLGRLPTPTIAVTSENGLHNHQSKEKGELEDDSSSEPETLKEAKDSLSNLQQHRHLSKKHRKELTELYTSNHHKYYEVHKEALQNARNTIILVAILIATVTFTAGINPPGGVYQNEAGPLKGKSVVGRTTAFKIFVISNNIALFTSLSIVIVLVSIIPFQRKQLMKLLVITHKVMWVAASFMAVAFVAATCVIVPNGQGTGWMLEVTLAISFGTLGIVCLYLGVLLSKHWLRKLRWRKQNGRKKRFHLEHSESNKGEIHSESSNSDVDSSTSLGYHVY